MSENKELISEELEKITGGFHYSEEDHAFYVRQGDCFININNDYILEYVGSTQLYNPSFLSEPTFRADKYIKLADGTFKYEATNNYCFDYTFLYTMTPVNRNDYKLRKIETM